jgi:hypothetical protein
MTEPRDKFDAALRDRIAAAESRVQVTSLPPDGRSAEPRNARWLRPALMFATAASAFVLAVLVIGQLPDRSTGGATPSPSAAAEGVSVSARNGDFVLTLSSPRSMWSSENGIEITATLSYLGDEPEVEIGGGGGPVVFSLVQLEGGNAVLGGGQDLPCLRYPLGPDAPLVWPFQKAGAVNDRPPFDLAFFQDPELHLPPGRWEVRAVLQYGIGDCSDLELIASIQLDVLEAEGSPGPSAVATEPPISSSPPDRSPTPVPTPDDGRASVTGVLEGDPQLEGGCVWLRDQAGTAWEIIWPAGYEATFREGSAVIVADGGVAARAGDRITVYGSQPSGAGSHCQMGIVYEAESVLIR